MAPPPDEPVKEDPIYKKWWFWGIVAATGFVVYELATTPTTSSSNSIGRVQPTARASAMPGGLTLLRW